MEHVGKIWVRVAVLERACKEGGYVILINPVSWVFHKAPIDCWPFIRHLVAVFPSNGSEKNPNH